jgi:hypothetical protein
MTSLIVACRSLHAVLAIAAVALGFSYTGTTVLRFTLAAVLTIPILAAARGLWHARVRTLRGFTVLLVGYVGLGTVEVLATGGRFVPSIFLVTAAGEFTAILMLLRRQPA